MKKVWYAWENPNKYHDVHVWYGYDKIYERNFKKLKLFIRKTLLMWWQFGKSEKGNDEPSTCTLNPTFFFVCMPQRFTSIRTPGHRQEAGSHPIHPVCIWTKQFWLFYLQGKLDKNIKNLKNYWKNSKCTFTAALSLMIQNCCQLLMVRF